MTTSADMAIARFLMILLLWYNWPEMSENQKKLTRLVSGLPA